MTSVDYKTNKVDNNKARKMVAEIISKYSDSVHFSRHSLDKMKKDNLTTVDVWNVLKSSDARIVDGVS